MPRRPSLTLPRSSKRPTTPSRFALMSDVHGNLSALQAVASRLAQEKAVDYVVVAGDLLQGGAHPREVWDFLTSHPWILLRGNEDDSLFDEGAVQKPMLASHPYRNAFLAGRDWTRARVGKSVLDELATLPTQWRIPTSAGDLLVVHASPRSVDDRAGGPHNTLSEVSEAYGGTGAAAIAFGHYHHHFVRVTPLGLLINVASVGLPVDNRPLACLTILTAGLDEWIVEQHQIPYDPSIEEREAIRRGMPPWVPDEP